MKPTTKIHATSVHAKGIPATGIHAKSTTAITTTMASAAEGPSRKPDAERTWKELEDHLIPSLGLGAIDRSVYSHLLRHSRLEGKRRLCFSMHKLARRVRLSRLSVRDAVRRLIAYDVLGLVERSTKGHVVEVRLPEEVGAAGAAKLECLGRGPIRSGFRIERADFYNSDVLRQAIHVREAGLCFYCRKRLTAFTKCLDHVIPQVRCGRNSYRNLVSCCSACNSQKNQQTAREFLRQLYREQRLTSAELKDRLRALQALAAGELRPAVASPEHG